MIGRDFSKRVKQSLPVLFVVGLFGLVNLAHADKQYRCSGRIQYRPCENLESGAAASDAVVEKPAYSKQNKNPLRSGTVSSSRSSSPYFAQIVKQSFRRLGRGMGEWFGVVRGMGKVNLKLAIYRAGAFEEERFIGSVNLIKEKSTHFGFRSSVPTGAQWESRVIAWAEPHSHSVFGRH